ncbi:hypothetical protein [Pseudofrankia inefficax]|uniref:hypothetical protein n=1 Tax=Pseudofrankia inefficax (strain DSM 45817 / CECT 9037 / DDB 130130 / EuI1c) TaxID=298654 RepID=UPI00059BD54E|nr:hypothetical protein [Pseudofrankia inefficax]
MPTDDRGRLLSDDGAWVWDAGSHQWLPHVRQPGNPGPSVAASRDDFFAVERVDEAASAPRPNGTTADAAWVIGGSTTRPRTDGVVDPFAVSSSHWDRNGSDTGLSVTGIDVGPAPSVAGPTQVRPGYGPSAQAPVAPTARTWPAQPSGGTAAEPGPQRPSPVSGPVRLGPVTGSVRVGGDPPVAGRTQPAGGAPTAWNPGPLRQTPGAASGPAASPLSAPAPAPDPAAPVSAAPNIFFTPARGLPVTQPGAGPSSGQPAPGATDAGTRTANPWASRAAESMRASLPDATASPWRTPTVDGPNGRAAGFDPYPVARTSPPAAGSPPAGSATPGFAAPGVPSAGSQPLSPQPFGARPSGAQPSGAQAPAVQAPAVQTPGVRSPGSPAARRATSGEPAQAVPGFGAAAGDPASSDWRTPVRPTAPPGGGEPGANGQWRRRTGSPIIDPRDPLGTGDLPSSRPITSSRTGPPPQRPGAPASPSLPAAQSPLAGTGGQQPAASGAGLASAPVGQPGRPAEPRVQGPGRRSRRHGQPGPAARDSQHTAGDAVHNGASAQNGAAAAYGEPGRGAAPFGAAPGNHVGAVPGATAGRGRRGGAEHVGAPPAPVEMTSVLSRAIGGGRAGRDVTADPSRPPGPAEQSAETRARHADAPATDLLDPVRPGVGGPATTGQPGRTGPRRHTAGRSGTGPGPDQGRDETRRNGGPPDARGGASGPTGGYRGGPGERPDDARPVRDELADLLEPAIPADAHEPAATASKVGPTGTRRRFATEDLSDLHDEMASRQAPTARRGAHGDAADRLTWFRHGWLGPLAVAVTLALVALGLYVLVSGRGGGGRGGGSVVATTPPSPAGTNPDAKVGKALVDGTYICQAGPSASVSATAGATTGATTVAAGTTSVLLVPATTGTYTWNGQSGAYVIATPNYDDPSNIIASVSFSSGPLQGDTATSIAGWPKGGGRVTATVTLTKGNSMFCKLN